MTESSPDIKQHTVVAISSLIRAFHCPRQYYFIKDSEWKSSGRYTICKQVSCAYPGESDEESLWNTICIIYPDISPELRSFLSSCLMVMKNAPVRPWTSLDSTVRSTRLGLYGQLDKFDARTGECTLIRCTRAPKNGCWLEDRIRTAALLLCLEDSSDIRPGGIYIEYIQSGIIRYYEPTPKDRRQVVQTLRQIHLMGQGVFPPKPLHPPCKQCEFEKKCAEYEPRRLSSLFKKG
jgi:CRISPR-associated exonuclease Cas4